LRILVLRGLTTPNQAQNCFKPSLALGFFCPKNKKSPHRTKISGQGLAKKLFKPIHDVAKKISSHVSMPKKLSRLPLISSLWRSFQS
jgi:hypothetical protein